jgi:hypothetical protein
LLGAVRETYATHVEHDQSRERGETRQETFVKRVFPLQLDVAENAGQIDEVAIRSSERLVRDVNIAALGIVRLGAHSSELTGLKRGKDALSQARVCLRGWLVDSLRLARMGGGFVRRFETRPERIGPDNGGVEPEGRSYQQDRE